jgi:hypothetical protein
MSIFEPDQFPLVMSTLQGVTSRERHFRDGLITLSACIGGGMRKATHDDLKYIFGSVVEKAYDRLVSEPFMHGGRYLAQSEATQALAWSISLSSLHDVLSVKKKLDKTSAAGPMVDAMKALIDEVHPLAVAMAGLKAELVKGRAPPSPEQRARAQALENPNKVVKTCPCCFRGIALAGQTMAHHGYERPGYGSQTASCMGIRFKPLEVSSEGLVCILTAEKHRLGVLEESWANRGNVTRLQDLRDRKAPEITPADPRWVRALASYVGNLESQLRFTKASVAELQGRLDAWVQTEPDGLESVREPRAGRRRRP